MEQKQLQILQTTRQLSGSQVDADAPTCSKDAACEVASVWHVVLLGRTFRDKTVQEVAERLMEALELEETVAFEKASSASGAMTLVVGTFNNFALACRKVQSLREVGLQVQVVTEAGLPCPEAPSMPKGQHPGKFQGRRSSYSDVFQQANPRVNRSSFFNSTDGFDKLKLHSPRSFSEGAHRLSEMSNTRTSFFGGCDQDELDVLGVDAEVDAAACRASSDSSSTFSLSPRSLSPRKHTELSSRGSARHAIQSDCFSVGNDDCDRLSSCASQAKAGSVVEASVDDRRITPAREEACALLRFLLFGDLCATCDKDKEAGLAGIPEGMADQEEIRKIVSFWEALDTEKTDVPDRREFRRCVDPRLRQRFKVLDHDKSKSAPKWSKMTPVEKASNDVGKLLARLRDKMALYLFGKKSHVTADDLIKLARPLASVDDFNSMKACFVEIAEDPRRSRVKTPPVIRPGEYKELCAVFEHFDKDNQESLSFDNLIQLGLIDSLSVEKTRREWDADANGILDKAEFCEMMCPLGFRASRKSKVGTLPDGRRIILDPAIGHWQIEQEH